MMACFAGDIKPQPEDKLYQKNITIRTTTLIFLNHCVDQGYHKQKMTLVVVVVVVVVAEMFSICPKASTSSNCPSATQYKTFSSLVICELRP